MAPYAVPLDPSLSLQQTKLLFVALNHCNKEKNGLLHSVTAPKKNCIWCHKVVKSVNNANLFFWHFCSLLTLFGNFLPLFASWRIFLLLLLHVLIFFSNFLVTFTNFVCCSDSVRQTRIMFVAVTSSQI